MKPFRGTAVLSVFVVALALYTAWEYKKAGSDADIGPQEKKLFNFTSEQVEQIKLTHGNETVLLLRDGEGWKMKAPADDAANSSAIDAMLMSIAFQKGKIFRASDESKATNWQEFGMEPPGYVLTLTVAGKEQSLEIGSKNAFDGSYYLRQGKELMLGDHGLAQVVARNPATLRSRNLWREHDTTLESAQIQINWETIKDKFTIKKETGKWALEPKPAFKVDESKLDHYIAEALSLLPSEVVSDKLTEEDKRAELLLLPSLTVNLNYKKSDQSAGNWLLTVGQDKGDDVYLYTNHRPTIYKTARSVFDHLRVPREFFRDGKTPFKFPVEQAAEIEVVSGAFIHTFTKDGSAWKLKPEDKEFNADPDVLVNLLHKITSLEARDFVNAKLAKGFKPQQHIAVRDGEGKVLFELSWGDEYKAKQPYNKGMTFRFVRTNLEKEAMGVDAPMITKLIEASLVTRKAEKAEKK